MKVGLCIVCTGKYRCFLKNLLSGARTFFCPHHYLRLFVFADGEVTGGDVSWHHVPHEPWPGPTLHRFHYLLTARAELLKQDYLFYCDVDMEFVEAIGDEVLGDLVATLHPGYVARHRHEFTYERRQASAAFVPLCQGRRYYAGGFQGGRAPVFVSAMEAMRDAIDRDTAHGITAVWHDESHWNRYLIDHPPTLELSPAYCCPETWQVSGRKLLCLCKDHKKLRAS